MPALLFTLFVAGAFALDNGLVRTPILGYNTYNDVACSPNSTWLNTTMHALVEKGFPDLGYKFFQLDCGWQGYKRQANGSLTYDDTVFPDGIKPLSDLAISLGLEWSMYTDQGVNSCDTRTDVLRPGSLGYETQDALQFAGWNVAYVKVDNCYVTAGENSPKDPRTDFPTRYGAISDALQAVGIDRILVCQWGTPYINATAGLQGPSAWTPALATSYRISDDIASGWKNVLRITNEAIHAGLQGLSGPGQFADMDLLEVGNPAFTVAEQQTHFAIWATFKSALMISTNVPAMSDKTHSILSNADLIAINQDPLGEPVKLVQRFNADYDLYSGALANGDTVILAYDQSNTTRNLTISFSDLGISCANAKDLYTGTTQTEITSYTSSIQAHGSIVLRLSSVQLLAAPTKGPTYYAFSTAAVSGGANIQTCSGCETGRKAGNIAANSSATVKLSGIQAGAQTEDVLFDYLNCEIGYSFTSPPGTNVRGASISVNGGPAQIVEFPLSGYNWNTDLLRGFKVRLSGFVVGANNTIAVKGASSISSFAPDFDRVGISN